MTFNTLIIVFLVVLVVVLGGLFLTGRREAVPSVSVSLGILFTFVGITVALVGFDETDIQASIPALLGGMKLAFITSIIGMGVGVLTRVFMPVIGAGQRAPEVTIETLAEHLEGIRRALVGEGEATVHTQLGKLHLAFREKQDEVIQRQDRLVEGQDLMVEELREFAETVTESNVDALIEALEEVMRDFNTKINEQLGESFVAFNEGVGRMMEWQEAHKSQVERMAQQLEVALASVQASERALQTIEERSRRFADTADRLHDVLEAANAEVEALEGELRTFAAISEQAKQALPRLEKTLDDLTTGFAEKVRTSVAEVERAAREQREAVDELVGSIREEHAELGRGIERLAQDTSERIAKQFEVLDEELGRELEKALTTLGSQLASLSSKFVEDYTPLTAQLQRLVEASRAAERNGPRSAGPRGTGPSGDGGSP